MVQQTPTKARLETLSPVFHVFVVRLVHLCEVHPPAEDAADASEALAELATLLGSAHTHKNVMVGIAVSTTRLNELSVEMLKWRLYTHAYITVRNDRQVYLAGSSVGKD